MDECKPLHAGGGPKRGGGHVRRADSTAGQHGAQPGRAVQVDPIKPMLKPPGTKHSKLKCDEPPSSFAFNSSLRRYSLVRDLDPQNNLQFLRIRSKNHEIMVGRLTVTTR